MMFCPPEMLLDVTSGVRHNLGTTLVTAVDSQVCSKPWLMREFRLRSAFADCTPCLSKLLTSVVHRLRQTSLPSYWKTALCTPSCNNFPCCTWGTTRKVCCSKHQYPFKHAVELSFLASFHGTSEAAMILRGVVTLLGDHILVHYQGHLLALIVVYCASMA